MVETNTEKDINTEYKIRNKVMEEFPNIIAVMGSENPRLMICEKGESLYTFEINPLLKCISKIVENYNLGNNKAVVTKILNLLKIHQFVDEKTYFSHDLWQIPFKNGYYDVRSEEFRSKEKYPYKNFFYEIPHSYNEDFEGDCPIFNKALEEWLYGQHRQNPTKPDDLFEIMGYLMTMNVNLKKAFYIYGGLNSGKTTFQTILLHIIGEKNRVNISLKRMVTNQFGTNGLQLKIIDMVGDHGSEEINHQSGIFKELLGGDEEIAFEGKGRTKGKFLNHCKLIFAGNSLPKLTNPNDEAYYFRWILINFANSFEVTKEPFSKSIIEDPNEVQGIIHECIKGVYRLYDRGHFSEEITKKIRHCWLYNSNPLYRFVEDRCIEEWGGKGITCESFKRRFQRYVVKNKLGTVITQATITKELEALLIYRKQKTQVDGERKDRYMDIRFLTNKEIIVNRRFDEHYDLHEERSADEYYISEEMNELKELNKDKQIRKLKEKINGKVKPIIDEWNND